MQSESIKEDKNPIFHFSGLSFKWTHVSCCPAPSFHQLNLWLTSAFYSSHFPLSFSAKNKNIHRADCPEASALQLNSLLHLFTDPLGIFYLPFRCFQWKAGSFSFQHGGKTPQQWCSSPISLLWAPSSPSLSLSNTHSETCFTNTITLPPSPSLLFFFPRLLPASSTVQKKPWQTKEVCHKLTSTLTPPTPWIDQPILSGFCPPLQCSYKKETQESCITSTALHHLVCVFVFIWIIWIRYN